MVQYVSQQWARCEMDSRSMSVSKKKELSHLESSYLLHIVATMTKNNFSHSYYNKEDFSFLQEPFQNIPSRYYGTEKGFV